MIYTSALLVFFAYTLWKRRTLNFKVCSVSNKTRVETHITKSYKTGTVLHGHLGQLLT
jgi:hypothetical protein